ncbi:hypothetical protein P153DRAFT_435739 [Dothidotthia symphoricarpi CBS 119687]|uniref:Uncharacterized protein n=1 Tax=Dothidotthia symphoricarpi CBS 119687 TaxID=1392245 RepID=A0A6A5ZVP9_9PLEO|nr:uncharacterized protein P153DRAFT_435739 [Dothidotthia symphoricarpi CBS 119687]KAF2123812.1 hypothetical protein P153DRAFT_435739 [Dothidotthia symphoricarpi CBS 119687]
MARLADFTAFLSSIQAELCAGSKRLWFSASAITMGNWGITSMNIEKWVSNAELVAISCINPSLSSSVQLGAEVSQRLASLNVTLILDNFIPLDSNIECTFLAQLNQSLGN